jgi:nucleoside-diphosphate-sugar epimerase
MATPSTESPKLDVTVRVGCSLVYEVTGSAMLLLNLRPCLNRNHSIVFEALPVDDPQVRQPDITRARQLLGWEPEVGLEEGLRRTLASLEGDPARA